MIVVWILFVCSLVILPATAVLALSWAVRHGEFHDLSRTALSIFDEDEPVGRQTDHFPATGSGRRRPEPGVPTLPRNPSSP
jgi:nitrogen fixation-related uncharacterized protein